MQVMNRHKKDLMSWKAEVNKVKKKTRELHSLRCDLSYKLNVSCSTHHAIVTLASLLDKCLQHITMQTPTRCA